MESATIALFILVFFAVCQNTRQLYLWLKAGLRRCVYVEKEVFRSTNEFKLVCLYLNEHVKELIGRGAMPVFQSSEFEDAPVCDILGPDQCVWLSSARVWVEAHAADAGNVVYRLVVYVRRGNVKHLQAFFAECHRVQYGTFDGSLPRRKDSAARQHAHKGNGAPLLYETDEAEYDNV